MKSVVFILFFPCILAGQTIHFENDEIVYQGKVNGQYGSAKTTPLLQQALLKAAGNDIKLETEKNAITGKGVIDLQSPFRIIRKLHYTIRLTPDRDSYTYRIDSVYIQEKRRGGRIEVIGAKVLLEEREQTGVPAIANEKLLNEIDLHFQKLLAVLKRKIVG